MAAPIVVRPGQRLTAEVLNAGFLLGTVVFAAFRDSAQEISSGTVGLSADALSWDNVTLDALGGWDAGLPTRYTPPRAGRYLCLGGVGFTSDTGGAVRGASWRQNGNVLPASTTREIYGSVPNQPPVFPASSLAIVFDGDGDYVELCPFQNSGSTLDTGTGSNRPYANILYVGSE